MNSTEAPQRYRFAVSGIDGAQVFSRGEALLAPAESRWIPVSVQVPAAQAETLGAGAHKLVFEITREAGAGERAVTIAEKSTFVVPR